VDKGQDAKAQDTKQDLMSTSVPRSEKSTPEKSFRSALFHHRKQQPLYWPNAREMQRAMHALPGVFRAILLELLETPMNRHEIRGFLNRMGMGEHRRGIGTAQLDLEKHLSKAMERKVLEERGGLYHLTPGGREIAEHMRRVIPVFMNWVFSPKTASLFSLATHVVFSILKLSVGFFSKSAGLIADGIDNTVDTFSSLLVWLGIKYGKEKLVSIFIMITIFVSVGGVSLAAFHKFAHPEPVQEGPLAFVVAAICGLAMLGLSSYQYLVGKKSSNFAIMCQSVDSRNHFWTSLLVCGGILLSFLAQVWNKPWLFYGDAVASGIIGVVILRAAIELVLELLKGGEEGAEVSHFMGKTEQRTREKILFQWVAGKLQSGSLAEEELETEFTADFCEQTPKILILSGMGYRPENASDLHRYLHLFVKDRRLVFDDGKYWLVARP